jgi:hypothetical protein
MDFSTEIVNFQKTGNYTYQIDGGDNLLINTGSSNFNQNYISIPLNNDNYDVIKLNSFYPIAFTEFISPILTITTSSLEDVTTQLSQSLMDNSNLQTQLTSLTNLLQDNTSSAEVLAAQQTIISLRIANNQGTSSADFSSTFPYNPLT